MFLLDIEGNKKEKDVIRMKIKIISLILIIDVILVNIHITNNIETCYMADFCSGCGCDIDGAVWGYVKQDYGVIGINIGQKEAYDLYYEADNNHDVRKNHINPLTGEKCSAYNPDIAYGGNWQNVIPYSESMLFPEIALTQDYMIYTGEALVPSFSVIYRGRELDKNNYGYYVTKTRDTESRSYSYIAGAEKTALEKGDYYIYVLFDPDNTAGPNGEAFLGRLTAKFSVVSAEEIEKIKEDTSDKDKVIGKEDSGKKETGNTSTSSLGNSVSKGGLVTNGGNSYYFDTSGNMVKDAVVKIDGKYYYFGESGIMEQPDEEYVKGIWFEKGIGSTQYSAGTWMHDESGWWYEDNGWYPVSEWKKIDGKWYYFTDSGYMDYSEYRDGYWLGSDGAWVEAYSGGDWYQDGIGWWYSDSSGWYPVNEWIWIDGTKYWFGANGYWG